MPQVRRIVSMQGRGGAVLRRPYDPIVASIGRNTWRRPGIWKAGSALARRRASEPGRRNWKCLQPVPHGSVINGVVEVCLRSTHAAASDALNFLLTILPTGID